MRMLEQLTKILKTKEQNRTLRFWRLHESFEKRREYYTLGENSRPVLDQARMVEQKECQVEVWVDKGELQGSASKVILPGRDLEVQVEEVLAQALVSAEKKWQPGAPSESPKTRPQTCFTGLKEDFLGACDQVYSNLQNSIFAVSEGSFNSSELFCVYSKTRILASNGFQTEDERSRFYAEVCFSARDGEESQEFLVTEWAMHPDQLNFKKMCEDSSVYAQALLKAEFTPQGEYSVLLGADVLNEVLHDLSGHLDARSRYFQMPFKSPGEELISGFEGEAFQVQWNPLRDWSMSASAQEGWGLPLSVCVLAENNKVRSTSCSQQMSQYLDLPVSTTQGCLEVKASGRDFKTLTTKQPTLEILQFSGLFTSAVDLTFSSEIRLARLWDSSGGYKYLKGGSLSGSVNDHFRFVEFSNEPEIHNKYESGRALGYYGPSKALIHHVPVTA